MLNTSVCYSWMTFHLSSHSEEQCIQGPDLLLSSFFELVQQLVKLTAKCWSELVFVWQFDMLSAGDSNLVSLCDIWKRAQISLDDNLEHFLHRVSF